MSVPAAGHGSCSQKELETVAEQVLARREKKQRDFFLCGKPNGMDSGPTLKRSDRQGSRSILSAPSLLYGEGR